jgi:asparagine synthase (glutamine-hydrolysing)
MIAHWLQASHAPAGRTLYESVQRLPGGHRVLLGAGPGRSVRYWLPRYAPPWQAPRDELVARLRETLGVAVDRRLTDARRPGVLLSGGIDSSAVSAVAAARGRPLHGVSALFPDHPSNDESELIDATTRGLRMPSTRMVVRASSVLAGALDYLARWQLPPTTPNMYFWTPLMQEAAAAGIDVMLDGEGGDETFFLSPYLLADRLRRGRLLSAWRLSGGWTRPAAEDSATLRRMRLEHYGIKGAVPPLAHTISRRVRRPLPRYVPGWIRPDVAEMWLTTEQSAFEWKRLPGPRWWAWLVWAITQSVGPALVYEHAQRRTGGAGIDARHPLVDVDVVELMLRMPPELSFEPVNRPLLRDAVSGVLPEPVRTRPAKSTFDESFHAGLIGFDLQVARRLLGDGHAAVAEYVDVPRAVEELLDEVPAPGVARMGWGWRLWRLLTCECWLRTLDDREFPERLARTEGLALPEFDSGGSAAAPRP